MIQVGRYQNSREINGTLDINVQKPLGQQGTGPECRADGRSVSGRRSNEAINDYVIKKRHKYELSIGTKSKFPLLDRPFGRKKLGQ